MESSSSRSFVQHEPDNLLFGAPAHKDGVGMLDDQVVDGGEELVSLSL